VTSRVLVNQTRPNSQPVGNLHAPAAQWPGGSCGAGTVSARTAASSVVGSFTGLDVDRCLLTANRYRTVNSPSGLRPWARLAPENRGRQVAATREELT
jgi:hypothetical protein